MANNKLLTEAQASEYLGNIPVKTLQRWRTEGSHLKFIKMGKSVRYSQIELDRFIQEGERTSTVEGGRNV